VQLILAHFGLVHKVVVASLILTFDASSGKQVLTECEMLGILCNGVQPENCELEFRMARVPVELAFIGSHMSHEAFDVLSEIVMSNKVPINARKTRAVLTLIITSKNRREPVY
jgi:hypothetical protein